MGEEQTSESSGDSDDNEEHGIANQDADSDFSIDDSDSEEECLGDSKEDKKESCSSSEEDPQTKVCDAPSRKRVATVGKEQMIGSKFSKRTDDAKLALLRQRYEQRKHQKEQK